MKYKKAWKLFKEELRGDYEDAIRDLVKSQNKGDEKNIQNIYKVYSDAYKLVLDNMDDYEKIIIPFCK